MNLQFHLNPRVTLTRSHWSHPRVTPKTRVTQVKPQNYSISLRDECASTTGIETTLSITTQDLLRSLATPESAKLAPLAIKSSGDKHEKYACDLSILIKSKSIAKRQHRNAFKLQSHHDDARNLRSALNSQGSHRVLHRYSFKSTTEGEKVHATGSPKTGNTKVQLAESVSSLQKIYFAGLRKLRSSSAFQSPHCKCGSLEKSCSCPIFLTNKDSKVRKSISFCYGDTSALPRVALVSEIASVKRVIAELLKGNLYEEAVDIVTVANQECYVMPVMCAM